MRTTFAPTSRTIVAARAVSGSGKGILDGILDAK
jgi:hypothetical protein